MKRHLNAATYVFLGAVFAVVLLTDATLIVRDTDITTRGKTFRVMCAAEGESFVGWFSKNGEVKTMISGDKLIDSHMYVLQNGNQYTLIIQDVTVADGGTFHCRGSQHTRNFTLFVEFYSKEFPKSQKVDAGKNSTLKCAADGYPYPIFKWYKNNQRINLTNPSYTLLESGSLALTNVHEDDAGNYTCLITQLGEMERQREERKHIKVTVFGQPSGEMYITNKVTQLSSTSFTLKWTKPTDGGGDPDITYTVEFSRMDAEGNFVHWRKRKDIRQQEYDIIRLERGAEYEFRVTAINGAGQSDEQAVKRFRVLTYADAILRPGSLDMIIYDIKMNCTSPNMYLEFSVKDSLGLDKESFRLRDSSCTPYERTTTNVLLKTALDDCGTTSKHRNKTVTYYNSVIAKVNDNQDTDLIMFPFSCTFGKENIIGIPRFQTRHTVMAYQAGFGNFTFLMNLYKDKEYENPYQVSEYPVTVQHSSTLYGQAELKASDAQLVILLTTCTATPSMNPDDPIRYPFIQRGCPADDSVRYTYQHSSRQQFQLVPFRFKQESQFVYLHCEVLVCHKANHSRCIQGCQRIVKKRSFVTDFYTHSVTLGPIQLERKRKAVSKRNKNEESKGSLVLLLLAIIGTALGTPGIFVVVIYILRKTKLDKTPPPQLV